MKYEVKDSDGKTIISSGDGTVNTSHSDQFSFDNNHYTILLEAENTDEKKSGRVRKTFSEVIQKTAVCFIKVENSKFKQYNHIIQTISAQITQKMDGFFGDEKWYSNNYAETLENIENFSQKNRRETNRLIHYFNKMAVDLKSHIEGWEIIYIQDNYQPRFTEVSLKKAILNQLSSFTEEFEDSGIQIRFGDRFLDTCTVRLDKKLFSLIMYNFFSNALKYSMSGEVIWFNYINERRVLDISMYSIRIEKSEFERLFDDGVRGEEANKVSSSGSGSGLYVIKKALKLMSMPNMYIDPQYAKTKLFEDITYVENHFKFDFNQVN